MANLPELMVFENGEAVKTAKDMKKRRQELLRVLGEQAYGPLPPAVPVTSEIKSVNEKCCSGSARETLYEVKCRMEKGEFVFPVRLFMPAGEEKRPLIAVINFRPSPYDEYIPVEEIVDNGFALAHIYYGDITADNSDFTNGLAAFFSRSAPDAPGKISLWAWGISRALDALLQGERVDRSRVGVIGHSRLGKTALWCAANDERVRFACSNDSGCMGAALSRKAGEGAESVTAIGGVFPYWFCPRFQGYKENEAALPFDQHFLLACIAPRKVLVNSASKDAWASPQAEQAACLAASPAWGAYGLSGYLGREEPYGENEGILTGDIGYYKRYGIHFLGRKDWQNFMEFIVR